MGRVDDEHWDAPYGGDFLKADDLLYGPMTLTIANIDRQVFKKKKKDRHTGEKVEVSEEKRVIYWQEKSKAWIVCRTASRQLAEIFGDSIKSWIGGVVTIYRDHSVKLGGKTVGGIRVLGSPSLKAPVEFEFAENSDVRKKKYVLIPTGALEIWCREEGTTMEALTAYIAANPVPRGKDRAPLAELPPEADRAAFVQFLSSPRGQQWSQNLQRAKAQTTADDGGEGEE